MYLPYSLLHSFLEQFAMFIDIHVFKLLKYL